MSSCQPVAAMRFGGAANRFVSTTPPANETLAPTAASTPAGSRSASGRTTTSPTPSAAMHPTVSSIARGRLPVITLVKAATSSGCSPPTAAATPPGKRYTATTSSGKKMPKLKAASTPVRHHSAPRGRQRETNAPTTSSATPDGTTRIDATNSGRPSGSNSVTVTEVVPHASGARTVVPAVHTIDRRRSSTFTILILRY